MPAPERILETQRLILRRLTPDDAGFYLELINDAAWIQFIGDKGIRTLAGARESLLKGPIAQHDRLGFSLCATEQKEGGLIGICGLIKRDTLPDVDLGFAFLPVFRGQGYAFEAASAMLEHGRSKLGLARLLAIVTPGNQRSISLLARLGFAFDRLASLEAREAEIALYARTL